MARTLRLLVIVLALAYSTVFGAAGAIAGVHKGHKGHRAHRLRVPRVGPSLVHLPHIRMPQTLGERAARYARRLLGVPYRYGGDSPQTGFDCSGFVRFVYGHFGLALPHSSYADFGLGAVVARSALEPGDLVFFDGVGHVGMYIGGGRFIHAPHTGTRVQVTSLDDPWYRASYDGARRLAAPEPPRRRPPAPRLRRLPKLLPRLRLL
jgi:hypothetical protein